MERSETIPAEAAQSSGDGRRRVVIEGVSPEIDGGRFPVKRAVGQTVTVEADIFTDGHDRVTALLLYRREDEYQWHKVPMTFLVNDRWQGIFTVDEMGAWRYTLEARIDHFGTWRHDLEKKFAAGQDLVVDREIGARQVEAAALRATGPARDRLVQWADRLRHAADDSEALTIAADQELAGWMAIHHDPQLVTTFEREMPLLVERREALFSAWYELFPRSCCPPGGGHGTFRDCESLLPEIARMGFDVLYFPPIHPIGRTNRKGKNNAVVAESDDPGSPWAIGAAEGGHTEVHSGLGSLQDFERFVARAAEFGIQMALDVAFQCSPDHPYVRAHPEWFRWRPDGTVQFAENPPKRYEDIIPFDFESGHWAQLWEELSGVIRFWAERGIRIFRVDNPHTKPFAFWEWAIREIRRDYPDTIFLSEAFTRPKVMYRLAKAGFSQSYTYFSWRNTKQELEQYLTELCAPPVREFFRPNFWPNTPDILPEFLQIGGPPAFIIRFLLAATLSASYGIYGPPFELMVAEALPGKEEYLDSEKYQVRCWDWNDPAHLRDLITRVNRIRHASPALQTTWNVRFCETDNDEIIAFLKVSEDGTDMLLIVITLDPFAPRSCRVRLPLADLGISAGHPFLVHELLEESRGIWHHEWNEVALDPASVPARIWRIHMRLRRENDFDYFM